jgi:hypothetical protein
MRRSLTPKSAFGLAFAAAGEPCFGGQLPVLGRFIADFLAPAARLVVEVDGGHHAMQARADTRRDAVLVRAGYRVLRFDAALVIRDIEAAVSRIRAALHCCAADRAAEGSAAPRPLPVTIHPITKKISGRVPEILSSVSVSVSVGAGRFDARDHGGRLLMRDPHENRGFRVGLPDGRSR